MRPISLIGFSLGARVIFYALLEPAKQKKFGIVQDVFLLGATLSVSQKSWCETRSVVSGRYVNAFARNDWVLNYLFRASSGTVGTVAGLRPIEGVPGLENVDVTDKIAGHMSYRTFMPLILDLLGFPVFSDFFDEPEVSGLCHKLGTTHLCFIIIFCGRSGTRLYGREDRCPIKCESEEIWLVFSEADKYYSAKICFSTAFDFNIRQCQESTLADERVAREGRSDCAPCGRRRRLATTNGFHPWFASSSACTASWVGQEYTNAITTVDAFQ